MGKGIICLLFFWLAAFLYSQDIKPVTGQKVLLIYEESNENIDPWRVLFHEEFKAGGYLFEDKPAREVGQTDLSVYDLVVIYGSVMAFTSKEPVRDWLEENPVYCKNMALFVTANRWFLDKYFEQLEALIVKNKMSPVDAVSMATKEMDSDSKRTEVNEFIARINRFSN